MITQLNSASIKSTDATVRKIVPKAKTKRTVPAKENASAIPSANSSVSRWRMVERVVPAKMGTS